MGFRVFASPDTVKFNLKLIDDIVCQWEVKHLAEHHPASLRGSRLGVEPRSSDSTAHLFPVLLCFLRLTKLMTLPTKASAKLPVTSRQAAWESFALICKSKLKILNRHECKVQLSGSKR